jgi:hypothetical protein
MSANVRQCPPMSTNVRQCQPLSLHNTLPLHYIYSLGVVLWELETGYKVAIPIGMDHEEFFRIENGSVPKEYEQMVQMCLKSTPGDRSGMGR